jgi:cell filamentation protein
MKDPYLISGTETLRNKLGITDPDQLELAIDDIAESAALKLFESGRSIPPTMAGWRAVHRAMFGQIFDWGRSIPYDPHTQSAAGR